MDNQNEQAVEQKYIVPKLVVAVFAMFCFGFLLVPIYDVFCEVTGLNGKTKSSAYEAVEVSVDKSRLVEVQFVASNNDGMVWEFKPNIGKVNVHPGEPMDVTFFAANPTQTQMVAQAIPSVAPGRAAQYFHKTECFCFEQQALNGKDSIDMPLRFIVDPDLPPDVKTITLSYTLFDVTKRVNEQEKNEVLDKTNEKFKAKTKNNDLAVR